MPTARQASSTQEDSDNASKKSICRAGIQPSLRWRSSTETYSVRSKDVCLVIDQLGQSKSYRKACSLRKTVRALPAPLAHCGLEPMRPCVGPVNE